MTERRSAVMFAKYDDEMSYWNQSYSQIHDLKREAMKNGYPIIVSQQNARKDPLPLTIEDPVPTRFYRIVAKDGTVFKCRPTSTVEEAQEKQNGLIVGDPARWALSSIQMGEVSTWAIIEGNIDELVEASIDKLKEMADGVA